MINPLGKVVTEHSNECKVNDGPISPRRPNTTVCNCIVMSRVNHIRRMKRQGTVKILKEIKKYLILMAR